jgi:hypothetical protein
MYPIFGYTHFAAKFGGILVEFWPSFDCAWFGAVGANGEQIGREEGEQFEVTPGALRRRGVEQERRPLSHPGERGLERDAPQQHVAGAGGVLHDGAHQIVGDGLQQVLALDHRRGASAQHIQPEDRLDIAKANSLPPNSTPRVTAAKTTKPQTFDLSCRSRPSLIDPA